jgi:O-antigen ligase
MIGYLFLGLILVLPFQFALNLGDNADLVMTRVLIPVIFLLWLTKSLARKKMWIPNKPQMWLIAAFLFLSFLSLFFGQDASAGFRKLLYFITIFPVFFLAADIFREQKWREKTIVAVIISGTLASAIGSLQFLLPFFIGLGKAVKIWENAAPYFLGNSFGKIVAANSSWLVNIGGKTQMRAFGFFPDPHNFAFFTSLCLFSGLGYFFSQKKILPKIWIGAAILLMLLAIGLSFSRGAYLGFLTGIIFFALALSKKSGILGKALFAVGVIFVLIFIFNSNIISRRLASSFDLKEGSNSERYKNWVQAVEVIRDHPLGGVGMGNYSRAIDPTAAERSSIYAHNLFLDIAAETGILNSLVFLLLILVSFWINIRKGSMISLGLASGLVAFFTHSFFDTALYSPQVLTMLLVVMAYSLSNAESTDLSYRA